jgi:hypothetical protein
MWGITGNWKVMKYQDLDRLGTWPSRLAESQYQDLDRLGTWPSRLTESQYQDLDRLGTWPSRLAESQELRQYDLWSHGTQTHVGMGWRGPAATVNYRPNLSSERVLQNNKPVTVKKNLKEKLKWSRVPDGIPAPRQTGRLNVGRKLTSTLTSRQFS